jgi:hypothetical protein
MSNTLELVSVVYPSLSQQRLFITVATGTKVQVESAILHLLEANEETCRAEGKWGQAELGANSSPINIRLVQRVPEVTPCEHGVCALSFSQFRSHVIGAQPHTARLCCSRCDGRDLCGRTPLHAVAKRVPPTQEQYETAA